MNPSAAPVIESLESRIAPAVVIAYTDIDGDRVRITDSSNTLTLGDLTLSAGASGQLLALDLTAAGFADANISISVIRKPGGDGLAHVGFIDATGIDLGKVTVKGDLGRIVAGDATTATPGLDLLSVRSLGARGLTTQDVGGTLDSVITGPLGRLSVTGNVIEASLTVVTGTLGSVSIGGSLVGGSGVLSGSIFSDGAMGNVSIRGSILGGTGDDSGRIASSTSIGNVSIGRNLLGSEGDGTGAIESGGALGKVHIGGNLVGGAGADSGQILAATTAGDFSVRGSMIGGSGLDSGAFRAGSLGNVKISGDVLGRAGGGSGSVISSTGAIGNVRVVGNVEGGVGPESGGFDSFSTIGNISISGDLIGASGPSSGRIRSDSDMGKVSIGGDVRGGAADGSGQILSDTGDIGHVKISGWLVGGSISTPATLVDTGVIRAGGGIDSVKLGGSLFAGSATGGGILVRSGAIIAGEELGAVSVGGSLLGNSTNPVRIIAKTHSTPSATEDRAIASVTVRRDAVYTEILAGFGFDLLVGNADASVGAVKIGGDWIAGSIVAGAEDGLTVGFGLGDALQVVSDDVALTARIASITIGGGVRGTAGSAADHFGFVSQQIDRVRIGGIAVAVAAGPGNDNTLIAGTDDVRILEVV